MTNREKKLVIHFLKKYIDRETCAGCTDWKWPKDMSQAEKEGILDRFHQFNISDLTLDELLEEYTGAYGPDTWLMALYLVEVLEQELKESR